MSLRRCRKDFALLVILVGLILLAFLSLFEYIVTRQLGYVLGAVLLGLVIVVYGLVGYYFDVFGTERELWTTIIEYWTRKKSKQTADSDNPDL